MGATSTRRGYGRPTLADGPAITLEQIQVTALRIAEHEGFEAIAMRRIAVELDVTPRALYHYVSSKHQLLETVARAALQSHEQPALGDDAAWDDRLRALVEAHWRVLLRYRGLSGFLLKNPEALWTDGLSTDHEYTIQALRDAGLDQRSASRALLVLSAFVLGLIEFEAASRVGSPPARERNIDAERFPNFAELHPTLTADETVAMTFPDGLEMIIEGIRSRSA
jgi:AcrR family transcriptional regulator